MNYKDIPVYDSEPYNGRLIGWNRVLSDGTLYDSKPFKSQLKCPHKRFNMSPISEKPNLLLIECLDCEMKNVIECNDDIWTRISPGLPEEFDIKIKEKIKKVEDNILKTDSKDSILNREYLDEILSRRYEKKSK